MSAEFAWASGPALKAYREAETETTMSVEEGPHG